MQRVGGSPGVDRIALQLPTPGTQMSWHSCSEAPPPPVVAHPSSVQLLQTARQAPPGGKSVAVGAALGADSTLGSVVAL